MPLLKNHIPLVSGILIGLVAIAIVFITPVPGFSKPPITWEPEKVTETIAQGETKTTVVSFTSKKNLTNVSVWVVPELQPYVSVTPSSFSSISKGDMVTLTLTLSAPPDEPLETFEGTIHLRDGKKGKGSDDDDDGDNDNGNDDNDKKNKLGKTYAKPLPVTFTISSATEGWQQFIELEGLYSVMFPPDVAAEFVEGEALLVLRKPNSEEAVDEPGLFFSVDPNPQWIAIEEYYDGSPGVDLMGLSGGVFSTIMVGGIISFKFIPVASLSGASIVIVPIEGEFIRITDDGDSFQEDGLLELILGTMEF